jgi:hypothetical protein
MNNYTKRIFEMLVRVLVFRSSYEALIGKNSPADQLFQKVETALKEISAHSTSQASERNALRRSSSERTDARDELRKLLESVSRTAESMGLKEFFMPRDKSDRAIADVGRIFVTMAEPLKKDFIANHMPEEFIDRMKENVENIERSIAQQAASRGGRKAATTGIRTAQADALAAIARLDPIMENLFRDNGPVKSVWETARRVEKAPAPKKPVGKEQTVIPSPAPASPTVNVVAANPA